MESVCVNETLPLVPSDWLEISEFVAEETLVVSVLGNSLLVVVDDWGIVPLEVLLILISDD